MSFASYIYIIGFLPATCLIFWLIQRISLSAALWSLVIASAIFYVYWNPRDLIIAGLSVTANYFAAKLLLKWNRARWLFFVAVAGNLLALGYYKYLTFLIGLWDPALAASHRVVLPLGISFFTFTQIAYLADCWVGKINPKQHIPRDFFLFVSFFPHLIAGPILHHSDVFSQFRGGFRSDRELKLGAAIVLFSVGLFKKVVLADNLSLIVAPVFALADGHSAVTSAEAWTGALAYALQIYFDFSGYSDRAVASPLFIVFRFPFNFNSPYKATSIIDFWRRWHMTLSRFLRDYLYIPLGGNRHGHIRRYYNIFITMLLGGIWHGAGINFVIWGALHGFFIVINHLWNDLVVHRFPIAARSRLLLPPAYILTMACVLLGWLFFRAETTFGALALAERMFWPPSMSLSSALSSDPKQLGLILLGGFIATALPNSLDIHNWCLSGEIHRRWAVGAAAGALFAIALVSISADSPFLYFQF